ncbi:MAG: class C sortase [Lachnospiraceae bacterium]|nr:class C sortase [Lachnospiraceae bacterium]
MKTKSKIKTKSKTSTTGAAAARTADGAGKKKKKKKSRLSTVLFILMVIAGLGVMLYPTASDYYNRWRMSQEIAQYNKVAEGTQKDYSELWEAAEEYNRQLAENGQFSVTVTEDEADYIAQFLNPLGTGMMGYLDIPAINVHIPIYQGTDEAALQAGAGFWLGTSLPTGGESTHCVLTAHNGLVKAKMFTDLDQLVIGDTFTLTILDRQLTYEVDQILVVEPDDFSELNIVEGEDYVTLYTCTPYGVNTHRLLVRGHRVETVEEETITQLVIEQIQESDIWFVVVVAVLLLILILLLLFFLITLLRTRKKEKAKKAARAAASAELYDDDEYFPDEDAADDPFMEEDLFYEDFTARKGGHKR